VKLNYISLFCIKKNVKFILLFFCSTFYGQLLHRQTLSTQGGIAKTQEGITVLQTVGQQSVIGNYSISALRVGQGFQQSAFYGKKGIDTESISTIFTPNPFDSSITFTFSKTIADPIRVLIYDLSGKIIFTTQKNTSQYELFLDNLNFPSGAYIVRLLSNDLNFSAKILKNK
jgi:hypothetical protein